MPKSYHMSADEFRRRGHALIDWIADYHESVSELPVLSRSEPGEIRNKLPASAPTTPESFDAMMADLDNIIVPGITHWQSPNFFAYFPCNASGPAILGELLSAGLNVQGMLWATSPACTELEIHVLDWLVELLGLPPSFASTSTGGGVIQDSASSATLVALIAAREQAKQRGVDIAQMVAYTSIHAHSSIEKAARIAALGHLRKIGADSRHAMDVGELENAIKLDREAGLEPVFVCATQGTTSSLAFDPVTQIGELCARESLWLHVDAAMAGTAALCPELRVDHNGLAAASSYTFNPHKWMFTNFDCNCLFVADKNALVDALSITPEYLRNQASETGNVTDFRDWQIPLGRRFRALKLWFTLRHYGREGLQHHVREHIKSAAWFASKVNEHERLELATPVSLNLVCFRHAAGDAAGRELLAALNDSGELYVSHTELDGRYALRFCVGQTKTTQEHVEAAWSLIERTEALLGNRTAP